MNEPHNPLVPWPPADRSEDPFEDIAPDRVMVFVPAIMSVGLVFSLTTLLRDALERAGKRLSHRRIRVSTMTSLADLVDPSTPLREHDGRPQPELLARRSYLTTTAIAVTTAVALSVWSSRSFVAAEGEVRDIAWILAASLILGFYSLYFAAVSWSLWRSWPAAQPWTLGLLRLLPLSLLGPQDGSGPSRHLSEAVVASGLTVGALAMMARVEASFVSSIDEPVLDRLVDSSWIGHLEALDLYGSTVISIGFVALIGLSAFRCRVMAVVIPATFAVSWVTTTLLQDFVERARPELYGDTKSFPSGHMVQAVFIAGVVPIAIGVLTRSRGNTVLATRVVLSGFVLSTALLRVNRQDHWPLDIVAGATLGLFVVLGAQWVLAHRSWHRSCDSCPWSGHPGLSPWRRGLFDLDPVAAHRIGVYGVIAALLAAGALLAATQLIGLPTDPEGDGLGTGVLEPAQLTLAALMGIAGLVALRWKAFAAFTMALCATGIGLLAAAEYSPLLTVALAGLLMAPAVLIWISWQPHATVGTIAALAILTVSSLTVTTLGSREVYAYYYGPTHPSSVAAPLESDAEWLWLGGVGTDRATIVAGGLADTSLNTAGLSLWSDDGTAVVVFASIDRDGLARFELENLQPSTTYSYSVDVDGDADRSRPDGVLTTFAEGAQNLTILVASCAQNESNTAVFDAMVEEDADLYLALGDLHYANLESTDPDDHLRQYGRSLSQPGQSALFRSVPTAYVWDDHDFGPNDADSSSPTRDAVSLAYRQAVPTYGVDSDPNAPITQAFTVGRVRVVMSDTRSQRTATTMLGDDQLAWLIDELVSSSQSHEVVIWANPTPWISSAGEGSDDWSAFPDERRQIADALADANVRNLVMVSGDAHMLAIDDGTNSDYSTGGGEGFPLLHGAALDRPGSVKGGPYSHGIADGVGQYGVLEVLDDGGTSIDLVLSGRNWRREEVLRYTHTIDGS